MKAFFNKMLFEHWIKNTNDATCWTASFFLNRMNIFSKSVKQSKNKINSRSENGDKTELLHWDRFRRIEQIKKTWKRAFCFRLIFLETIKVEKKEFWSRCSFLKMKLELEMREQERSLKRVFNKLLLKSVEIRRKAIRRAYRLSSRSCHRCWRYRR